MIPKKIIETVSGKGYVLHAGITTDEPVCLKEKQQKNGFKKYVIVAFVVLLLAAGYLFRNTGTARQVQTAQPETINKIEAVFSAISIPPKRNYLNTIATTDTKGFEYCLYCEVDKIPEFYINGQLIPLSERDQYAELIDNMLRSLWNRQKKYNDSLSHKDE